MNNKLIIIGSSGHASVVIDALDKKGKYEIIGLIDDFEEVGTKKHSYEILGSINDLASLLKDHQCNQIFIAIGEIKYRFEIQLKIEKQNPKLNYINVIHPDTILANSVKLGKGIAIFAGSILNSNTVLKDFALINTATIIEHDCVIGEFASIAPKSVLGGHVNIGDRAFIGMSSTISDRITIGNYSVVGADSFVLANIPDFTLSYGRPAKQIQRIDKNYLIFKSKS